MNDLLQTIAGGVLMGAGIWWLRKQWRAKSGFAAKLDAPPAEGFAAQSDVAATAAEPKECVIHPGIAALRSYVLKRWGGADAGICGDKSHQERVSDHNVGRAWDWAIPSEEAADEFLAWLAADDWTMARRLGVGTIIHRGTIWSSWVDGKLPMTRKYKGSNPHNKHVHLSLSKAGSRGKTSGYAMLGQS